MDGEQAHKVEELLQGILEEVAGTMPANTVRCVRDRMHAMLGPDKFQEASGGCFLRVDGDSELQHSPPRAAEKGFGAGASPSSTADGWRAASDLSGDATIRVSPANSRCDWQTGQTSSGSHTAAGTEADASGANGRWETTEEFRAKLREVFDKMDVNQDGTIDEEERKAASGLLNELHLEFGLRAEVVFEGAATFDQFAARLVREWEVTSKEQALAGVNVVRAVAELLPGGSSETPLEHLEGMSGGKLRHFCTTSVAPAVEKLLELQQEAMREEKARRDEESGEEQGNAKFAQSGKMIGQVRMVHLRRSTFHAISCRGISQLGFWTVE